ncbi:uncharacterized protein DS421_1g32500 [Arachis hypogaea]|nr:uncharacterized protein DS421_1g32500 [Arachis hypogaea]
MFLTPYFLSDHDDALKIESLKWRRVKDLSSDRGIGLDVYSGTRVVSIDETHSGSSLIRSIRELLTKPAEVKLRHIFRESNYCVDALAKHGQILPLGITCFENLPSWLFPFVRDDLCSYVGSNFIGFFFCFLRYLPIRQVKD